MKYLLSLISFIIPFILSGQQLHHFTPSTYFNKFSLNVEPVLRINAGDTVRTHTVDAMGRDKNGNKVARGGNPLTGPFYIINANAGDVLVIHFNKIILNRSYAYTTEAFGSRSVPKPIASQFKRNVPLIRWKLDREAGFAMLDTSYEHLKDYKVPLNPFLGCIGVAPANRKNEILSFFPGPFGGNLDFNRITQSSTIYLPVFHDGAYFYVGDGHALQGDGEIAGNALETSMDVEFTVNVIKKEVLQLTYPRIEDSTHLMAVGVSSTLDDALKIATQGLLEWLQQDYHLSLKEATQVMSTSIEYAIAEIADPEVEVVAKIKKDLLKLINR